MITRIGSCLCGIVIYALTACALTICAPTMSAVVTEGKQQDSDSLKNTPNKPAYRTADVDVTAQSLLNTAARQTQPTSLINAKLLQTLGARQIPDALVLVPGVFVRNYGGLGGLKTVSLRGANAAQTLVLVDGVRVNSTQSGQVDLSLIPVSMIESIEVVRGGAAAQHGAAAMGGVLNIRTKRAAHNTWKAQGELASFGEGVASAQGSVSLSPMTLSANAEYQHSQGNFPFPFNEFGQTSIRQRENGDFTSLSGRLHGAGTFAEWNTTAHILARHSERGTPGAVVQGSVEMARARLQDDDVLTQLSASRALSATSALALSASWRVATLHYRDPDARTRGAQGINEQFFSNDATFKAKFSTQTAQTEHTEHTILPKTLPDISFLQEWSAESVFSDVRGNMLQPEAGSYVRRINTALAGTLECLAGKVRVQAGGRLDWFSDFGVVASPLAGIALLPDSTSDTPLTARSQWSYNFRPPAFNELYYLNFGNAHLSPERGHSLNVGATTVLAGMTAELDGFAQFTENQIVAVPTSPVTWSAQNVGFVQTFGAEASIRASIHAGTGTSLLLQGSLTVQRATDETPNSFTRGRLLVYTPNVLAGGVVSYTNDWLTVGATAQYVGTRFSLPSNSDDSLLPAFVTIHCHAEAAWMLEGIQLRARLQCDNLLDARYAVVRNFPMPGRAFRLLMSLANLTGA